MIERVLISVTLMISVALVLASNMVLSADDSMSDHATTIALIQDFRQSDVNQPGPITRKKIRVAQAPF